MGHIIFVLIMGLALKCFALDCETLKDFTRTLPITNIELTSEHFKSEADKTPNGRGFYKFTWPTVQYFCSNLETETRAACLNQAATFLTESLACLTGAQTIQEKRALATSYLRNPELGHIIFTSFSNSRSSVMERRVQKSLWDEFGVLLIPGGFRTPVGDSEKWKDSDLQTLFTGYQVLKKAVGHHSAAHIWGYGGLIARIGSPSVGGQFGEVDLYFPMQINVVIDVSKQKTPIQLAQHIAHENGHSNDHLQGHLITGQQSSWSETAYASIFRLCDVPVKYETSLVSCYRKNPLWFNFHPSPYPAIRTAEFYTKMIDEWVREQMDLSKAKYRCQNEITKGLWQEMENQLLGPGFSTPCQ